MTLRFRVSEGHLFGCGKVVEDGMAGFEPPGNWGIPIPPGVTHFAGDRPLQWPLPLSLLYWDAPFGPLAPGRYRFEVWALDAEGHEQPQPDPNEHSGSARRESVAFEVG